jgi:hypothetical protein
MVAVDVAGAVAASLEVIPAAYPGIELTFSKGGDRDPARDAVPPAEAVVCDRLGIGMAWGVGGDSKADSSSRINEALGI